MLYRAHIRVEVEIFRREEIQKGEALVDTGMSSSVLLRRTAEELGIEAGSVDEVATGVGIIKVKRGATWIITQRKEDCSMSGFQT